MGTAYQRKKQSQAVKAATIAPTGTQLEDARTAGGAEIGLLVDGRIRMVTVKAAPGKYVTLHAKSESQAWQLVEALQGVTCIEC